VSSKLIVKTLTLIGRAIGLLVPRKDGSPLFFFFPYYQVGGAEKVHADIVACAADGRPWVIFTCPSKDQKFKRLFEENARVFDLSAFAHHRYAHYICLGALSAFINRHPRAVVFGSNNVFFYQLLPSLKKEVRRIDMVHAFGGEIEIVSLPYVAEIEARVICSRKTLDDLKDQYASQGVSPHLVSRITFIDNQVTVPDEYPAKQRKARLNVLYVGRGTEEKRVHLIGEAAYRCQQAGIPADFIFVGEVSDSIAAEHREACTFKGEIADSNELNRIYDEADVLVLASRYEGFPMAIMEAMAHGVVPLTTDVGGISLHVKSGANGLLIKNGDEAGVVNSLVENIERLAEDRASLDNMSRSAYHHARAHFAPPRFRRAYRRLLLQETTPDCDEYED
jgi:glycosyltransferase involved in cell wall biosynthesis